MGRKLAASLLCLAVSACSSTSAFRTTAPPIQLAVNHEAPVTVAGEVSESYRTTSFGQYHFKATAEDGTAMYGLFPLKFNGGYLALDILFFAPAMFFNLREMQPAYEIDIEQGVVRYRSKSRGWVRYTPTPEEAARARKYFAAEAGD